MPLPTLWHAPVTKSEFGAAFLDARAASAKIRESCAPGPPEAVSSFYLAPDRASGYAIAEETGELTHVFSLVPGRGDEIVRAALRNGAVALDCFDVGPLRALYERHGFYVFAAAANWTPGGPDVLYMLHPNAYTADTDAAIARAEAAGAARVAA